MIREQSFDNVDCIPERGLDIRVKYCYMVRNEVGCNSLVRGGLANDSKQGQQE